MMRHPISCHEALVRDKAASEWYAALEGKTPGGFINRGITI